MVSGQISLCFSEAFDSPIKSDLKAWLSLAWMWVLVCGLCVGWNSTNQDKVWYVTFEEMKEVLAGEESALSLTLSNSFMDMLEDAANKMCSGLADGGNTWGKNERLFAGKASTTQGKSPPAEKISMHKGVCDHHWGEHSISAGSRMWQWKIVLFEAPEGEMELNQPQR